jgi:hypothetical protein
MSNALLASILLGAGGAGALGAGYGLSRKPGGGDPLGAPATPPVPPSGAPAIDPNGQMMAKALQDRATGMGGWQKALQTGATAPPGAGGDLGIPLPGPNMGQRGAPVTAAPIRPGQPGAPAESTGLTTKPTGTVDAVMNPRGPAPQPVPMAQPAAPAAGAQDNILQQIINGIRANIGGGKPGSAAIRPPKPMMPRL